MDDLLCDSLGRFKSWSIYTSSSYHKEVVLELDGDKYLNAYPFKFNRVWLEEASFCKLVEENWKEFSASVHLSPMLCFIKKLYILKNEVNTWEK